MKSMTGFGRGEARHENLSAVVEISSVNRKQLDVVVLMPREMAELEGLVRKEVGERAGRGRVQVKISLERGGVSGKSLAADPALLHEYREKLGALMGEVPDLSVQDILRMPGVLEIREPEVAHELVEEMLMKALQAALVGWEAMRNEEGCHLASDIEARLRQVEEELAGIDARADMVVQNYRDQLMSRLQAAGIPLDLGDDRIVREIGLFAERCDTSEERTRLRSHFDKFRGMMGGEVSQGRSLDFLIQEMNREVNTIGAKANDALIAHHVVACKTELEKMREQIQNIE